MSSLPPQIISLTSANLTLDMRRGRGGGERLLVSRLIQLITKVPYTHLKPHPPTHTPIPDDQDRLADLLTRMFDDFSKAPSLAPPDFPSSINHHTLSVELSRVLKQYRQKDP